MKYKIWITRKIRIFSERRLERLHLITKVIMIYYSFILVCLSILNLKKSNKTYEEIIVITSLAILITSIFLSSQRFKERALYFKNCYLQLDQLYHKICQAEKNNLITEDKLEQYLTEYREILETGENHSSYDFMCLRYSIRKNTKTTLEPFGTLDYLSFWFSIAQRYFVICILFILPPIFIFLFKFN